MIAAERFQPGFYFLGKPFFIFSFIQTSLHQPSNPAVIRLFVVPKTIPQVDGQNKLLPLPDKFCCRT